MALAVDEGLGRLVDVLKRRAGAWDQTLLIFINDNGGHTQAGSPNTPLRGGKATQLEGGIHVRGLHAHAELRTCP